MDEKKMYKAYIGLFTNDKTELTHAGYVRKKFNFESGVEETSLLFTTEDGKEFTISGNDDLEE